MLARVADRLYWMARYLERAESIARVTNTFSHLMMDLPIGTELTWRTLLEIFEADKDFRKQEIAYGEISTLEYMIARPENMSSIFYSVKAARENARTTRDVLPEEVWESVNELYVYSKEFAHKSIDRRNRFNFLTNIVKRCHALNGLLMTSQIRDHTYRFIKLGHLLERIDITTRVVGTVYSAVESRDVKNRAFDSLIWAGLLESLSAIGNYRRSIGPMAEPHAAINFVFLQSRLPRSLVFCFSGIRKSLTCLNGHEKVIEPIDEALVMLDSFNAEKMSPKMMKIFVQDLQICAERLSLGATSMWFSSSSS
ncbi:MAG: alpha-E domain-containing protein [Porticoccaceae bacterium]|mgnify:FL=1